MPERATLTSSSISEDLAGYSVVIGPPATQNGARVYGMIVSNASTTLTVDLWKSYRWWLFETKWLPRIGRAATWALTMKLIWQSLWTR